MKFNRRHFLGAVVAGSAALVPPRSFAEAAFDEAGLSEVPALLPQAKAALDAHSASIPFRDTIGIVNFAAQSRLPRFQLIDLASGRVLETMLVAHGFGSDPANTGWVEHLSNRAGSNASCKGAFVTDALYQGKHGRSRKLIGLDPENNEAAARGIVIHAASYVDPERARDQGRIGRSQGCFAVANADISKLLGLLGPGRLLYAWKA